MPGHFNKAARGNRRRAAWPVVARRLAIALGFVLLVPFALTPVYRFVPPPASALMLIRAAQGQPIDYRWTPIGAISPQLVRAVVTAEDAGVCAHHGVEWEVLKDLMDQAIDSDGEPVRGGSTITMQTVKNLYLWPQRSYLRKAIEVPLAHWADLVWGKQRVVELYLNIAEWAPGVYGAEAAAQHHFGRPAARLTRNQALLLAAALPNPLERNAARPGPLTRTAARRIARRLKGTEPYLDCLQGVLQ